MKDIKNYTLSELTAFLIEKKYPKFTAKQIFNWLYKKGADDFEKMTDINKIFQLKLKEEFYFSQLKKIETQNSFDGTRKFLFGLADNNTIESVLIPDKGRNTVCLSSQVGCKFNCMFCLSGKAGFVRNLTAGEIVNQFMCAADTLSLPEKINNVVFMGIGEPLDNYENVIKAVNILNDSHGLNFGKRRIVISTCGLPDKIRRLADEKAGIMLSISLHAAVNELRNELMPVNRKYSLQELMAACNYYAQKDGYPVTFEYVLIHNVNDSVQDAVKLAKLVCVMRSKLNLIPYNRAGEELDPPDQNALAVFGAELKKRNLTWTTRRPRGSDIGAACGQLRANFALEKF